jgi:general secretion pathway protein C
MHATFFAFLVWALATGSAVFWGLRLLAQPQPVPANTQLVPTSLAPKSDLTRLLGTDPVEPAVSDVAAAPVSDSRLALLGVVAPRGSHNQGQALAVISVDGKPARTFRVGSVVEGTRVLQSVNLRGAELGAPGGSPLVSLSLAAPAEAVRGSPGATPVNISQLPRMPNQPSQFGPQGSLPSVSSPVNGEQLADGPPGAEGFVPGQDRAKLR